MTVRVNAPDDDGGACLLSSLCMSPQSLQIVLRGVVRRGQISRISEALVGQR